MTEETALTVQDVDYTNGDLALLGTLMDRQSVVTLGDNLMGVHPNAQEIGKQGMRTVAQLALMTGANPLPGTNGIQAWRDHKGSLCIQFGMGFWEGRVEERGGFIWYDRPRPMTDEERVEWGVMGDDVAYICKGTTWNKIKRLRLDEKELGGELSLKESLEMIYEVGVGTAGTATYSYGGRDSYKEAKSGRPLGWTAKERCVRDLCRKLTPIFSPGRQQHAETKRLSGNGPNWDSIEPLPGQDENDLLFGKDISTMPEPPEDAIFEEMAEQGPTPEPEPEKPQMTEPERHAIADIRAELEGNIKDGKIDLGEVYDAAVETALYKNYRHCYNAATNKETGFDFKGAKAHRKQIVTGKGGLLLFDWLVNRKVDDASEEEE